MLGQDYVKASQSGVMPDFKALEGLHAASHFSNTLGENT
jgi:hypothetical protein